MPSCHSCKYDGKANPICLQCPGPSMRPNNGGQNWNYLDNVGRINFKYNEDEVETSKAMLIASMDRYEIEQDEYKSAEATGLEPEVEDQLRLTIAQILSKSPKQVCMRLESVANKNKNTYGDACHAIATKFGRLTHRELQMVCGLCQGKKQTQIARENNYDPRISSVVRKSIIKKIGCADLFKKYTRKDTRKANLDKNREIA